MTATLIEERVKALDDLALLHGSHSDEEYGEKMCAMEAVAWIAGEPHSDHPTCACPVISSFMRAWNDGLRTDEERTRLLKPFLPRLVGTKSTKETERKRSLLALDWHNGVMFPAFLDLVEGLKEHAAAVRADHLNPVVIRAANKAAYAARDAAWAAAGDAAWAAARDAAWAAARDAARDAAWAAARDALEPTVLALQESSIGLLEAMLAVSE